MPQETMTEQLVRQIELLRARVDDLESRQYPQLFGTWTPTVDNFTNLDSVSVTANSGNYICFGSMIICFGSVNVDPTTSGVLAIFDIDLPITVSFDNDYNGAGSIFRQNGANSGSARAIGGDTIVRFNFTPTHTDEITYFYFFAVHNQT